MRALASIGLLALDAKSLGSTRNGKPTSLVAVIFFLVVIGLAVGVWALIAYGRAGAKAAQTGIDRTSDTDGPSLLEEDLSFAGRDEPTDDRATTRR